MSLLYINPGLPQCMEDNDFVYFPINELPYTKTNAGFIPSSATDYHTIATVKNDNLYYKLNAYMSLMNETWQEVQGFFKIETEHCSVKLTVNPLMHLQLLLNDEDVVYEAPLIQQELVNYELHINSTGGQEIIELWINHELVFDNSNLARKFLMGEQMLTCSCKNITYMDDTAMKRHGCVLSNFIISNTRIAKMDCENIITNIKQDTNVLTQTFNLDQFGSLKDNDIGIYGIQMWVDDITSDKYESETVKFMVGNTLESEQFIPTEQKMLKTSIMELDPTKELFWDYDTIQQDFIIKRGDIL